MPYLYQTLRELLALLTGLDREGTPRAWIALLSLIALYLLILYLTR